MKPPTQLSIEMDELQARRVEIELAAVISKIRLNKLSSPALANDISNHFQQPGSGPNTTFAENALLLNFLCRINRHLPGAIG